MRLPAKRRVETAVGLVLILAANATGILNDRARAGNAEVRSVAVALQAENAVSDRALASWVEKRVQQWQITAAERLFDTIGWARTIREAERLAKEHGRPVFLFTYDGRMDIGRC